MIILPLEDRPRSRRPPKADAVAHQLIDQEMSQPPWALGYFFGFWTVVTLCTHLAERLHLFLSRTTVRRVVWSLRYRWRRPRLEMPKKNPNLQAELQALAEELRAVDSQTVLLVEDESDVHLLPVLRAMWMKLGQRFRVPTPGKNWRTAVFGALNLRTGETLYALFERKCKEHFIHKAKLVREWLATHPQLRLLWLPTYPGEVNQVEKLWWRLKTLVAANRLHASVEALQETIHRSFRELTSEMAFQLAGLKSTKERQPAQRRGSGILTLRFVSQNRHFSLIVAIDVGSVTSS